MNTKTIISRIIFTSLAVVALVVPSFASAAQIGPRTLTLGSSAASATTTHTFDMTIPGGSSVGSMEFKYCVAAYGACTTPVGLVTTAATLTGQAGATGFTLNNTLPGDPYLTRPAASLASNTVAAYTLSSIINPSATNTSFYVRVSTYSATDATGTPLDLGVIAVSTASQITVTGVMPESLTFCVGTSGSNCTNITGNVVNLGLFSPSAASSGTSVMSASTNALSGYVVTLTGTTLASGTNTIPALGQQAQDGTSAPATTGVSGYGTNVRANTTPLVGADVTGLGLGAPYGGYNTINQFRYFAGDKVASAAGATKDNLYTNSYVVNVSADQAAGAYAATMTYICTATF